ncbi:MAG: hypothetical protein EOO15_10615 [Chitinophagaceae bacterium]|nr:MAG: hypothetical protein EOO15_10615 [Chitinophagaceae bacterium]
MRKTLPFLLLAGLAALWSCKSSKEELLPETPASYFTLESGKYIIYRLDSMVFTNSGRNTEWHSYQERHLVDSLVTDGLGRPAWRVFRSIRNAAGSSPWQQAGTFLVTVSNAGYELTEDNMRTLRLINPVRTGMTWKGNRYLGSEPYSTLFNFNNDDNIADWDYTVTGIDEEVTLNGQTYNGVATVDQVNESILPDTVNVVNDSVRTPPASKLIWIRGNATGPITIVPAPNPSQGRELSVYNFSNRPAELNGIVTPVDRGRNYEYYNGSWTYLGGVDTTTQILPFGFRSFGREQYARGLGLVSQEYVLYEFQPNPNGTPYSIGFGVKRTILAHN